MHRRSPSPSACRSTRPFPSRHQQAPVMSARTDPASSQRLSQIIRPSAPSHPAVPTDRSSLREPIPIPPLRHRVEFSSANPGSITAWQPSFLSGSPDARDQLPTVSAFCVDIRVFNVDIGQRHRRRHAQWSEDERPSAPATSDSDTPPPSGSRPSPAIPTVSSPSTPRAGIYRPSRP